MDNNGFIGMGNSTNPNVPDMPLGLGMALFQNGGARGYYEGLSAENKSRVISYVQTGNATGKDAKRKISGAVAALRTGSLDFLS